MAKAAKTSRTLVQRSRAIGAEQKAIYHHVAGAGKSRVKRQFFELSEADAEAIVARLSTALDETLNRAS